MKAKTQSKIKTIVKRQPLLVLKFVMVLVLLLGVAYTGVWISKTFFTCPIVDITCIDCYSPRVKKELVAFIRHHLCSINVLSFCASDFFKSIKDQFKFVAQVEIAKKAPIGLLVTVKGVKPVMRVNEHLILAQDRNIYSNRYFTHYKDLASLPQICMPRMHEGMQLTTWSYEGLCDYLVSLAEDFSVTYINSSMIKLVPTVPQRYAGVIINELTLKNNKDLLNRLDEIVQDAIHRGLCSANILESKRRSIELDMRFERRVIMKFIDHSKKRRGRGS